MNSTLLIARHGKADSPRIAFTFDDGPNPHATPNVLDILGKHGCAASFFLIGKWVLEHPQLVERMSKEGHCIGGHTFSHALSQEDGMDAAFDFQKGNKAIEEVTGKQVRFIRVPGFDYARTISDGSFRIKELLEGDLAEKIVQKQIGVIDRNLESEDWRGISARDIFQKVMAGVKSGSVIAFHDGSEKRETMSARPIELLKALPEILSTLKNRGFEFVTLDDLPLEYELKTLKQPNLDHLVKLYGLAPVEPEIQRLRNDGIIIKRAIAPEKHVITQWVRATFSKAWASECDVSFSNHPISCFVATTKRMVVGFSCYDATYKNFVGPLGVDKEFRNRGIGRILILKSLHSMAEQGYAYAILGSAIHNYFDRKFGAIPIQGSNPGIYKDMVKL